VVNLTEKATITVCRLQGRITLVMADSCTDLRIKPRAVPLFFCFNRLLSVQISE
jgi:hypothetical protein